MINSFLACSLYFLQDGYLQGNKITSLLFRLIQYAIFFLPPRVQKCLPSVSEHTCITLLLDAYFGGHVLSWVLLLQNTVLLYVWPWHYSAFVSAVSLSEQQSHFDTAPFCNIDKNSLTHGSWTDDENVNSPLKPPRSINTLQETTIA